MDPDQAKHYRQEIADAKNSSDGIGSQWVRSQNRKRISEFISVKLRLSEVGGMFHVESPSYSLGSLLSDVGGALGLVLGLSILDFLVCSGNMLRKGVKRLATLKRKRANYRRVSFVKNSPNIKNLQRRKSKRVKLTCYEKRYETEKTYYYDNYWKMYSLAFVHLLSENRVLLVMFK